MRLENHVAIFGAKRSGSTWLAEMLRAYFLGRYVDARFLSEYFNIDVVNSPRPKPSDGSVYGYRLDEGNRIAKVVYPFQAPVQPEAMRELALQRLGWLEQRPRQKYLFKVQPLDFSRCPELLRYLREHCTVICIEREELPAQLLSGCLSMCSGVWSVFAPALPPTFEEGQFRCTWEIFDGLAGELERYRELKRELEPAATVRYEDLLGASSPIAALAQLGIRDAARFFRNQRLIVRQNPAGDYLRCFSNRDEVSGWLRDYLTERAQ